MSFESFNQNAAPEEEKDGAISPIDKLKRAAQVTLAASAVAVGAAGCGSQPENAVAKTDAPDRFEKQSDIGGDIEKSEDNAALQQENLKLYYQDMRNGSFGSHFEKYSRARAVELAQKKHIKAGPQSTVEMETVAGVPVEIKIDGRYVPVSPNDYTPDELNMVHAAESVRKSMGGGSQNTPSADNHGSVGTFGAPNQTEVRRNPNPWGDAPRTEQKTNPDLKDFL